MDAVFPFLPFLPFLQVVIVLLRFLVPPLMLLFPFFGFVATIFLDVVDGDILGFLGMSEAQYQFIDKVADYYAYIFMLVMAWKWPIRNLLIGLLAFRGIGQALFFLTQERVMLVFFPNFFELLLLVYVSLFFWNKSLEKAHAVYMQYLQAIWLVIIVGKVINEWQLHVAQISISMLLFGFSGH